MMNQTYKMILEKKGTKLNQSKIHILNINEHKINNTSKQLNKKA